MPQNTFYCVHVDGDVKVTDDLQLAKQMSHNEDWVVINTEINETLYTGIYSGNPFPEVEDMDDFPD